MDKFKDARIKTEHTSNFVDNNKEKFDSYMFEQKEEFVRRFKNLETSYTGHRNAVLNNKLIKAGEKDFYKHIYKAFVRPYDFIVSENRDMIKPYFKTTKTEVRKLEDIRYGLNNSLLAINNPDYNLINDYKDTIELALEEIDLYLSKKAKSLNDEEEFKERYGKDYDLWYIFYNHKLKNYYKGYFAEDEDIDYRECFIDLIKPSKPKPKNQEETPKSKDETSKSKDETPKSKDETPKSKDEELKENKSTTPSDKPSSSTMLSDLN
jgi:hypothetical protein